MRAKNSRTVSPWVRALSAAALASGAVRSADFEHRGPTLGFRIEEHGRVLAYVPDHEPYLGGQTVTTNVPGTQPDHTEGSP